MRLNLQITEERLTAALNSCYMAERDTVRSSAFLLQAFREIAGAYEEIGAALVRAGVSLQTKNQASFG